MPNEFFFIFSLNYKNPKSPYIHKSFQDLKKLLLLSCNVFGLISFAQVGINTTTPNAQLDIRSNNQTTPSNTDGILIPKVDTFPATNPGANQQGMLIYLTTVATFSSVSKQPGFYYWDGTWKPVSKENYQQAIEKMGYKVVKKILVYIGADINVVYV